MYLIFYKQNLCVCERKGRREYLVAIQPKDKGKDHHVLVEDTVKKVRNMNRYNFHVCIKVYFVIILIPTSVRRG